MSLEKYFKKHKNINSRQKIILACLIFFVSVLSWFIFLRKDEQAIVEKPKIKIERKKNFQYSRPTFFSTPSARISVAIPDYWEGKYRYIERGNKIEFLYINNIIEPEPLMSIYFYEKKNVPQDVYGAIKFFDKNNFIYYYKLSTTVSSKLDTDRDFLLMKSDLSDILKSIK